MGDDMFYDLMSAVRYGSLDKIKSLINAVGSFDSPQWSNGYFLVLAAAEKDRPEVIDLLINKGCAINEKTASRSKTPLHFAIKNGDARIIEMLVNGQADLDAKDEKGKTPLHLAIDQMIIKSRSHWPINDDEKIDRETQLKIKMDIIELLVKRGADVDASCDNGTTVLNFAIKKSELAVVSMLLKWGACVNPTTATDRATSTPLHCAVSNYRSEVVTLLLDNNADPNIEDADGRTALHLACTFYQLGTIRQMVDHGADVNRVSNLLKYKGYTPLHFAALRGNHEIAKFLVEKGAKVDVPAKDDITALHLAVRAKYQPLIRLLLELGADVNARTQNGATVLQMAVETGISCCVETILNHRPDVDNKNDKSCVKRLVRVVTGKKKLRTYRRDICEYTRIIEKLIEYGFPINIEDTKNSELLYLAVKHGRFRLVERLLQWGADANAKFDNSTTPIRLAVEQGEARIVKNLLTNGACVDDSPDLLNDAVLTWNREIVELLLDHGLDVNKRNDDGAAPLYFTTLNREKSDVIGGFEEPEAIDVNGRKDMAKFLLMRGSIVDARTKDGRTALHGAAALGDIGLVEMLLEHGADVNSVDQARQTPLQLASAKGHDAVVDKIFEHTANVATPDKNGNC